ncbi:hypothetical protein [Streptomyces sp. NPDC005435]
MEEHSRHTTVEAEMPNKVSAETWRAALDPASAADQLGLRAISLNARTL